MPLVIVALAGQGAAETPLSALAVARLAEEAGVPRGVLQVLVGNPIELSTPLLLDSRVRALSFTGSTQVGRLLLEGAADTIKKVSLELGGHAPSLFLMMSILERRSRAQWRKICYVGSGLFSR